MSVLEGKHVLFERALSDFFHRTEALSPRLCQIHSPPENRLALRAFYQLALACGVELCLVAASRACSSVSNRTIEKPGPSLASARLSRPERPLLWRAVRGRGARRQLRREAAQRLAMGAATADAKSGITPIWANMVLIMA